MNLSISYLKFVFFTALFFIIFLFHTKGHSQANSSFSTSIESLTEERNDLLVKSRNQKTWAWVLMGTGVLATAVNSLAVSSGGSVSIFAFGQDQFLDYDGSAGLLIGAAVIASSIPLFIAGQKNLNAAIRMGLDMGINYIPNHPEFKYSGNLMEHFNQDLAFAGLIPGIRMTYSF